PPPRRDRRDPRDRPRARRRGPGPRPLPAASLFADASPRREARRGADPGGHRLCDGDLSRAGGPDSGGEREARRRPRLRASAGDADRLGAEARGCRGARRRSGAPRRRPPHDRRGRRRLGASAHRGPDPPVKLEERYPLSKLTTLGTGGPARWFGAPETEADPVGALARARGEGPPL